MQDDIVTPPKRVEPITEPAISTHTLHKQEKNHKFKNALSSVAILLTAPLIAILLILFVFQSYQVDGPSMEQTLHNNDRLIVWKAARTWSNITGNQYVPNRGDVIIFNEPGLANYTTSPGENKQLIKRVLGLPGERVVVKDGVVTVYNQEHPDGFQPDATLAYGKQVSIPETNGDVDVTLASNELFMCGDNRPNSLDSRYFGPIKTSQIVGKLAVRILPLSKAKLF